MKYLQRNGEIKVTDEKLGVDEIPNVYLGDDNKLDLIEFASGCMDFDDVIQIEFYYNANNELKLLSVNGYEFKLGQVQED